MRWKHCICIAAILSLTLFPTNARAQTSPSDALLTLRLSTQLVTLDATVEQKKTGRPIGDLTRFPQILASLSQDRLPLSVVFLFVLTESVRPVADQRIQTKSAY